MVNKRLVASLSAVVLFLIASCAARTAVIQRGYAPVNGLSMYYEIHGSDVEGRPPLVLLHGGGSTISTSFGKLLPDLSKDRRIIAIEQQGHGHTADIDRPFSFTQSADDTIALLRYLHVEKADFFGYSNGGHIAIEIALRHPEFVRKLVIESAMFSRDGSNPAFWESFHHAKLEDMPSELREAYLKTAPRSGDLPSFFAKSVERMLDFKGWSPEEIHSISALALVIIGDHDIVRPEHAVLMFHLLPNAELAILPNTNHMTIVNRADWIVSMVGTFLSAPMPRTEQKEE